MMWGRTDGQDGVGVGGQLEELQLKVGFSDRVAFVCVLFIFSFRREREREHTTDYLRV